MNTKAKTDHDAGNNNDSITNHYRQRAHEFVDKAADRAEHVEERIGEGKGSAEAAFAEKKGAIEEQLRQQYKLARETVQQRPLLTLGLVFAAGALIGRSLARSR